MIVELNIENFAIAEKLHIDFTNGFNVLTGETGAGKSIIIDAISLLLGGRASKELIRSGSDKAILEGLFYYENEDKIEMMLKEYGIENDNRNYLVITREIHASGRSVSRINGRTVTLNMLNNITKYLIDIHGQHEHQSLLNIENHINIIDSFGDNTLKNLKESVKNDYKKLTEYQKKLKTLSINEIEKDREIDLLKYQIEEIDTARLSNNEEENILNEYKKLANIKEIQSYLCETLDVLKSNEYDNFSVIDGVNRSISLLKEVKQYDEELANYFETLININYELEDLNRNLICYLDNVSLDEERLNYLEERLNTINGLKKKYGNTIDEIMDYRKEIFKKLNVLLNNEKEIEKIRKDIEKVEKILHKNCKLLSEKRQKISRELENAVSKELAELNMKNVIFKVNFKKKSYFTLDGFDAVEFLISTNLGEKLKPLSKIVSGGEMSRIMLAFKSILAEYDEIPCLIFDEIDTGISGRTAQVVGEKIKNISQKHQVICISHLPQIAALADTHYLIYKILDNGKTVTKIKKLTYEEKIDELARLLGGVNLTNTTKLHAKEMIDLAKKI